MKCSTCNGRLVRVSGHLICPRVGCPGHECAGKTQIDLGGPESSSLESAASPRSLSAKKSAHGGGDT